MPNILASATSHEKNEIVFFFIILFQCFSTVVQGQPIANLQLPTILSSETFVCPSLSLLVLHVFFYLIDCHCFNSGNNYVFLTTLFFLGGGEVGRQCLMRFDLFFSPDVFLYYIFPNYLTSFWLFFFFLFGWFKKIHYLKTNDKIFEGR